MNSYNGFTPKQRYKALAWFKKQIQLGKHPPKPCKCDICGQTKGALMYHSEDYSEPFGEHIGKFSLCFICHMMIHCRHKNPESWEVYKTRLKQGIRYKPFYFNDWNRFRKECLIDKFVVREQEITQNPNLEMLEKIENKEYVDYHD